MITSPIKMKRFAATTVLLVGGLFLDGTLAECVAQNSKPSGSSDMITVHHPNERLQTANLNADQTGSSTERDLAHQILATMLQVPGNKAGFRTVHAKGIVCQGTFVPTPSAATLSRAAHFQATSVPVTVRFSDGAPEPVIPDNSPDAGPRGMAIRFMSPGGDEADIVALSHNGFVVGTGEEFLALQKAIVATDPAKPHPWPVEEFLSTHPRALKFVQENRVIPASFATEAFFSNNSFIFVNKKGDRQAGRYQILPLIGQRDLSEAEAKAKTDGFLFEDIRIRLANGPVRYRLVVQLPNDGDPTNDASLVWPGDRRMIEVGTISVTSVAPEGATADKALAFDPTRFPDGIELSDDVLPQLRSRVYALAVKHRRQQ